MPELDLNAIPTRDFVTAVSAPLAAACSVARNRPIDPEPPMSLGDFMEHLMWRIIVPREAYVYASCLVLKLAQVVAGALTMNNVYRIFLCALICATGMLDDCDVPIENWAHAVRHFYQYDKILLIYKTFLKTMNWEVLIKASEFRAFKDAAFDSLAKKVSSKRRVAPAPRGAAASK